MRRPAVLVGPIVGHLPGGLLSRHDLSRSACSRGRATTGATRCSASVSQKKSDDIWVRLRKRASLSRSDSSACLPRRNWPIWLPTLDYEYEAPSTDALVDSARMSLYWQRLIKDAGSYGTRNNGSDYGRYNEMEERSVGLTGSAVSEFTMGNLNHEVRFGGNLQFSQTEQFLTVVPSTTVVSQSDIPNVDGKRLGLYLDDRIGFGDSGFALTPGMRFDWYDYDPKASSGFSSNTGSGVFGLPEGQDGVRLSPKLLATYDLTPEVELFGQWSMGYRPPTVNELYVNFTNGTFYANIGNPNLKPETSQGFELGASYQGDNLTGKITAFHNIYSNFIDAFGTPGNTAAGQPTTLYTWRNRDKVEISGVEISARKDFANGIFLHGSLAYSYGKDSDTGEFIRTVAPFKSILGVGYEQERWGLDLSTILSAGMREDGVATTITGATYQTFDAPGYGIFNLTAGGSRNRRRGFVSRLGLQYVRSDILECGRRRDTRCGLVE